jgi:glucoamylase
MHRVLLALLLAGAAFAQDDDAPRGKLLPRQNFNCTVAGNGALLATYDRYGTVLDVFWPTVGKYSNVHSHRSAYLLRKFLPGSGWLDFPREKGPHVIGTLAALRRSSDLKLLREAHEVEQSYVDRSNVLTTRYSGILGLDVHVTDASPVDTGDALVRTFVITNPSTETVRDAQLAIYANFDLAEQRDQDRASYDHSRDRILQENSGKRVAVATGAAARSSAHAVIPRGLRRNAWRSLTDGRLAGDSASGDVDWALTFELAELPPGQSTLVEVIYAFGANATAADATLDRWRREPPLTAAARATAHWRGWLAKGKPIAIPDAKQAALYERSLLAIKLLTDRNTGAIIAGPTLDPDYRFAWPRDGSIIATSYAVAGHFEECKSYLGFLMADLKRSLAAGKPADWASRYESDGTPYTGGQPFTDQVDDLGFVPLAIWVYGKLSGDREFVKDCYPALRAVAQNVASRRGRKTGLVRGVDYWEDFDGWYAPTQAIIASGMRALSHIARDLGEARDATELAQLSEGLKNAMLAAFWKEKDGFLQRTLEHNLRDGVRGNVVVNLINVALHRRGVDAGVAMMVYPLGLFAAGDPRIARSFARAEAKLTRPNGGFYPGEDWPTALAGNDPWIFWTEYAVGYLKRRGDREKMQAYLDWVVRAATPQGMLAERVFQSDHAPMSTTPLGWPHGSFVTLMHELYGAPPPVPDFFEGGRSE